MVPHAARSLRFVALLACALTLSLCARAAGAGASTVSSGNALPAGFVGMNFDGPLFPDTAPGVDISQQMSVMVSSGVETIRAVFDWSYAQPYSSWSQVPASEQSDFADVDGIPTRFDRLDALVGDAAAHGLTILPTIIYAPAWDARLAPDGQLALPARNAPYAAFAAALVGRYGPHGSFWATRAKAMPIHQWQIWNEPNVPYFWFKQPFEASYAGLLHAAHKAIKLADPTAQVVLAGMPNYSWVQLAQLFKVHGVNRWFEAVAVHPYTKDPSGVIVILRRVRRALVAAGDGAKPMIADELSWPSSAGQTIHNAGLDIGTTEAGQARKVAAVLPLLAAHRKALGLSAFYYYTWVTTDQPNENMFEFAGLFQFGSNGQFSPKPAFSAFRQAALALENCRQKGPLASSCARP